MKYWLYKMRRSQFSLPLDLHMNATDATPTYLLPEANTPVVQHLRVLELVFSGGFWWGSWSGGVW